MTQDFAFRYFAKRTNLLLKFLDDQTQELNVGKRKDRIRVYPSVVLRFYKRRREGDATQRIIVNRYDMHVFGIH